MNSYRLRYIIQEALETGDSIEKVASQHAFWSRSTFYEVFQNLTGMTPKRYIDNISENKGSSPISIEIRN